MISIKTKFILAISLLVIFLLGVTAFLLIGEKERELSRDIYTKARSFTELTAGGIVQNFEQFYLEDAFPFFQREMVGVFAKSEDLSAVEIAQYSGEYAYDSELEKERKYSGQQRMIEDRALLKRVQGRNPSFLFDSGRVVYVIKDENGQYLTVDEVEKPLDQILDTERIVNIVYPVDGKYAVIYKITYAFLHERVAATTERIIMLAIFGVLVGLGMAYLFSSSIINPLKSLTKTVSVIAKGNFKERIKIKSRDEVGLLADSVNQMAKDLEKSTKALIYRERVAKELELAARIQQDLLPKKLPDIGGLDLAAQVIPAAEIGGDCFDFITVNDKSTLMYIGDVTGHGVPSGLVVAVANAMVYSFSSFQDLKEILIRTNGILSAKTSANMFLTMLLANWNTENSTLSFISAGHEPMLIFQAESGEVIESEIGGMALGMVPDISSMLTKFDVMLNAGDVAVMYTDGIPEAVSASKEAYGKNRLVQAIKSYASLDSADKIKEAIFADVKTYSRGCQQMDDMTLLVIKKL